jgi:hypothetical protein
MHLDFTIRWYFKRLAGWIEEEIPKIQYNSKIWEPFKKYGQLNEDEARRAIVCNNTPPTIDVAFMDAYGQYYRNGRERNRNKIHLNRKLCRKFNRIKQVDQIPHAFELIMKATILHEMVHWGDEIKDKITQPRKDVFDPGSGQILEQRDVGFQFEVEAFYGIYTEEYLNH